MATWVAPVAFGVHVKRRALADATQTGHARDIGLGLPAALRVAHIFGGADLHTPIETGAARAVTAPTSPLCCPASHFESVT